MKKILPLFLTFALLTFIKFPVYAYNEVQDNQDLNDKTVMTIYDDEGNAYAILRTEVEENNITSRRYLTNDNCKTYIAAVPRALFGESKDKEGPDDSYCARVYLRVYYTVDSSYSPSAYRINSASGWYNITDSNITRYSADLNFFYSGISTSTGRSAEGHRTIENIPSTFNYTSGFSDFVSPVTGYVDLNGASVTIDFSMGTRNFTGELRVNI